MDITNYLHLVATQIENAQSRGDHDEVIRLLTVCKGTIDSTIAKVEKMREK